MITITDLATSVLTRSFSYHVAVESWLGGDLLAADVPIVGGQEEGDRSLRVPERVTFSVPRLDRGVSWAPTDDRSPLAANGQRLHVKLGIGIGTGQIEWFNRGRFLIDASDPAGDSVSVTGVGLLTLIDEARLVSPYQPTGTLASTLRALLEPAVTVDISTALTDRAVPTGIAYDEDRLSAVLALLDAWPADAAIDPAGYLSVVPADATVTPVLELTEGTGGTVIEASGSSARAGAANLVVARGTASDGGQVQGVAYDLSSGPKAYGGAFNPLPVPFFFASPLLTTVAQCTAAATTILARRQREASREFTVRMVPYPVLQLGDVVTLTSERAGIEDLSCSVEGFSLPYTPGDGTPMTLKVKALP